MEEQSTASRTWHCRNANGGVAEAPQSWACCREQYLGGARGTHGSSLWAQLFHSPSSARQGRKQAGRREQDRSLTRSLFYLRSPLLSFSSNSGPPDGEWLPGPQGKVRIYPPKAMPPSGGVNQVSALEDEGGITSMLSL